MDHFSLIHHQRAGGGIDCSGRIIVEGADHDPAATLRCDECSAVVGTINRWILSDLVNLATDLDQWQPTPEHYNRIPAPLQTYIHDLETRADPAGHVQDLALARMTIAALQQRTNLAEPRWNSW
jgi:hypothetical protein